MIELFPAGFEEVELEDGVELAAYVHAGEEERLWRVFGAGSVRPLEPGWEEAWKRFHRPVRIGPLWVGPPWESPEAEAVAVVVEPGRAFGTGAHPTTRLCLELLLERRRSGLVDLGCGSGVVAIAAAKLGFSPVVALDQDEAAVEAARANAAANGVHVTVRRCDVLAEPLPSAEIAVANIALDAVERLAARVAADDLIASGYLASEQPAAEGWRRAERRLREGWAADLFRRL